MRKGPGSGEAEGGEKERERERGEYERKRDTIKSYFLIKPRFRMTPRPCVYNTAG